MSSIEENISSYDLFWVTQGNIEKCYERTSALLSRCMQPLAAQRELHQRTAAIATYEARELRFTYYVLHSRRALLTYYVLHSPKKWCALTESSVIVHTLSLNQPPARPSVNDNKKEDLKANLKSEPPKEQDIKIVLGPHSALCPKFKA